MIADKLKYSFFLASLRMWENASSVAAVPSNGNFVFLETLGK